MDRGKYRRRPPGEGVREAPEPESAGHCDRTGVRKVSRQITDLTFGITLMAYLAVGVGGYVAVPISPPPNVLNACTRSPAVVAAQICLITALSLS